MMLLPIDRHAFRLLKVSSKDIRKIIKSFGMYELDGADEPLALPKRMAKRSVLAWSFLMTYRESPALVVFGMFAVFFIIPFVFFVRLFS